MIPRYLLLLRRLDFCAASAVRCIAAFPTPRIEVVYTPLLQCSQYLGIPRFKSCRLTIELLGWANGA